MIIENRPEMIMQQFLRKTQLIINPTLRSQDLVGDLINRAHQENIRVITVIVLIERSGNREKEVDQGVDRGPESIETIWPL